MNLTDAEKIAALIDALEGAELAITLLRTGEPGSRAAGGVALKVIGGLRARGVLPPPSGA